ncbi:MAG: hypothetical protein ACRD2Z_00110 [Thermoanaerobaculia bacterium]
MEKGWQRPRLAPKTFEHHPASTPGNPGRSGSPQNSLAQQHRLDETAYEAGKQQTAQPAPRPGLHHDQHCEPGKSQADDTSEQRELDERDGADGASPTDEGPRSIEDEPAHRPTISFELPVPIRVSCDGSLDEAAEATRGQLA